jgi:undecaprenyl diphosphate synthase
MDKSATSLEHLSEAELAALLDPELLPRHVAIIMDGNGRWAELRGLPRIAGHREGIASVREVVTVCSELGVSALTIYAFSQENWNRPETEIALLMKLLEEFLERELNAMKEQQIRFQAIGRRGMLPASVLDWVKRVENETAHLEKMTLTVALSYGGRTEIVDAAKQAIADALRGTLSADKLNEALFERYLYTYGLPDPDLLIRTSGEARISNFLLWQMAYTEMYFTKTLWPDFRRRETLLALLDYQKRERRFGRVPGAVAPQGRL